MGAKTSSLVCLSVLADERLTGALSLLPIATCLAREAPATHEPNTVPFQLDNPARPVKTTPSIHEWKARRTKMTDCGIQRFTTGRNRLAFVSPYSSLLASRLIHFTRPMGAGPPSTASRPRWKRVEPAGIQAIQCARTSTSSETTAFPVWIDSKQAFDRALGISGYSKSSCACEAAERATARKLRQWKMSGLPEKSALGATLLLSYWRLLMRTLHGTPSGFPLTCKHCLKDALRQDAHLCPLLSEAKHPEQDGSGLPRSTSFANPIAKWWLRYRLKKKHIRSLFPPSRPLGISAQKHH